MARTFKVKGFYQRGGSRFVGLEENGIIYGFPAELAGEVVDRLNAVMDQTGVDTLEELGFYPQTREETKRNVWEVSKEGAPLGPLYGDVDKPLNAGKD